MGCGASKVDDLPLVTLCRERKNFIKAASHHRCALAAAHLSYFHSLTDVGDAIRAFVDDSLLVTSPPPSPVLTLPSREGKSKSSSSSLSAHSADTHNFHKDDDDEELQDSHLHLSSDSDSDPDSNPDPHSGHIHIHDSPPHLPHEQVRQGMMYSASSSPRFGNYDPQEMYNPNPSYSHQYHSNPAPYENSNSFPPYLNANPFPLYENSNPFPPYQNVNPFPPYENSNPFPNAYYMKKSATPAKTVVYEDPSASGYVGSSYYGNGGYYSMMGGSPHDEPSPKKPPPVPPSPPRVTAWDYLNVFGTYYQGSGGDAYSGYYPTSMRYGVGSSTSSPDSKELREREGIPDLEDETEQETAKEMNVKKKNISANYEAGPAKPPHVSSSSSISISEESTIGSVKGKGIKSSISPDAFRSPDSIVFKSPDVENETVMRKKGVSFEVEIGGSNHVTGTDVDSSSKLSTATTLSAHATRDLQEAVKEIKDEFETASSYGKEVALMLEVGKLPYQYPRRTTLFKVISSRIVHLLSSHPPVTPPVQISSRTLKMAKAYAVELGDDFEMKCKSLSSTLEELYAWEKKLYKEVKDEESLRIVYEKKCKRLKTLDDNGAESSKIDATQASIRKLLTKINVCIRAVDAISSKIHRLRDEELQPQITELIHGLIRMWKSMVRCHQRQFQAIMESKVRTLKANTSLQRDSSLKATVELEMELVNWCARFNRWIHAQKAYVESLNEWLLRCLNHEPEETPDGIAPFSPGRIGAPPIFVICNDWCQAMVSISEKGVENAMLNFASSLHQLWERQGEEQHQRIKADHLKKDFEKKLRTLQMDRERIERGRIEREHDASSEKTMSKVPSESGVSPLDDLKVDMDSMREKLEVERAQHKEAAKLVHDAASTSVQGGLIPIFEALGNFTAEVLKAHEEVRLQNVSGS